ncbi:MAG: 4-hydroxy-3-methylbut-2-enyl diphosphate reductase [Candidatus Marinimicrobia bacterium]|nr:4-hydroxy-3-methylbut-2-enyl diphosphate reductase [Candidatus Neomarinimicrobiota bacterium]
MNNLSITVAEDAGFCFGVRRALDIVRDAVKRYGKVAMLGDIVHNERVVLDLERLGVKVYQDINDIPDGVPVIFRSHGTSENIWRQARERDMTIIDATCPLVREIHQAAKELEADGRQVIIIGDPGHDEVEGIASRVADPIIIANPQDADSLEKIGKAGVVIQSTQFHENVKGILAKLVMKIKDLRIINTICKPTRNRQSQLRELAEKKDVIIVVGSFTSANTKRLTSIAEKINPSSYQVQNVDDIQSDWFRNAKSVGISAGASTPDEIVTEVKEKISALPI